MTVRSETIAAIATPPGRGGIGVIRVSGSAVRAVMAGVIGRELLPRHASRARFRGANAETLDEGLALFFPAPHSYTGEDVLELHGHGAPAALRLLLARCVELGARLAEPGEFTRRAFLDGKIDLVQAEGVADLIEAATATAARAAARSLSGEFSRAIELLDAALVELRALTEATLDFPEEDLDFLREADARGKLAALRTQLANVLARSTQGALLRDGLTAVLVGQPNVGKSTLVNHLAGEEVAIVTPIAGTTRDAIQSHIEIAGIALTVVDTAGLRPTDDPIETLGVDRTWKAVERANLALVLIDAAATDDLADADRSILDRLPAELARIVVHNKIDLASGIARVETRQGRAEGSAARSSCPHVFLSAKTGAGVDLLRREILAAAGAHEDMEGTFLARERHLVALRDADEHLGRAAAHLEAAVPPLELFAEELREAQVAMGAITGAFCADDLLGEIFGRFCIGK